MHRDVGELVWDDASVACTRSHIIIIATRNFKMFVQLSHDVSVLFGPPLRAIKHMHTPARAA
jgi:hypothetical protein